MNVWPSAKWPRGVWAMPDAVELFKCRIRDRLVANSHDVWGSEVARNVV
jgi:hypothetical protein